jgi:DNA polymerase elongation subunit (family B)
MYEFMSAILDVMERYTTLAGYSIFTNEHRKFYSDLHHIENSCNEVGFSNRLLAIKSKVKFLDVNEIFSNNVIKGFLKATDAVVYRGGLDEVAQVYIGKGKTEDVSGTNVESLSPDKQLNYCLRDARLCYELLQKNDFELLHILYEISQEVKLSFFDTCNTQYPTRWWKSKLASIGYQKIPPSVQRVDR